MSSPRKPKATDYYWNIAEEFRTHPDVDEGTLMGFPCLRINGDFFSTCEHRTGDLIVKLPRDRVAALIAEGRGDSFAPAGRIFKEWLLVTKRQKKTWIALMREAQRFVSDQAE